MPDAGPDLRDSPRWSDCRREYRSRSVFTARLLAEPLLDTDLDEVDALVTPDPQRSADEVHELVRRVCLESARTPGGLTTLLAYLYCRCTDRWERSTDYPPILTTIDAAVAAHATIAAAAPPGDPDVATAALFVRLLEALRPAFAAENALNCSCPADMARHAARAVAIAEEVLRSVAESPDAGRACTALAVDIATVSRLYFSSMRAACTAVAVYHDYEPDGLTGALTDALEVLRAAEADDRLAGDVYVSDVRSYRVTLEKILARARDDRLCVEDGRVSYCYPFGLAGVRAAELIREVEQMPRGTELGSSTVLYVEDLGLTDVWEASDPQGRAYRGVKLRLSPLTVVTTEPRTLAPHDVQLRISEIGVCYLRISVTLSGVLPPELNQVVRRGSSQMGEESFTQDGQSWPTLAEFARDTIAAFQAFALRAVGRTPSRAVEGHRPTEGALRQHTVLSVHEVTLAGPSGERRAVHALDDLRTAVGASALMPRLSHTAATLEEYIRYPDASPQAVIDDLSFAGEMVLRSASTTVLLMTTTPTFLVLSYEEMAEFAAAVPALVDEWITSIYLQSRELARAIPDGSDPDDGGPRTAAPAATDVATMRRLELQQVHIQGETAEARSLLAFLRSPTLCRTAKYRSVLDVLLDAAGLAALERDLDAQLERVETLYLRVTDLSRRIEAQRNKRYRLTVEIALILLGVLSLAEFLGLVNDALPPDPSIVWVEVAVVLGLGVVLGVIAFFSQRRTP
jgi:hypothetical protein